MLHQCACDFAGGGEPFAGNRAASEGPWKDSVLEEKKECRMGADRDRVRLGVAGKSNPGAIAGMASAAALALGR